MKKYSLIILIIALFTFNISQVNAANIVSNNNNIYSLAISKNNSLINQSIVQKLADDDDEQTTTKTVSKNPCVRLKEVLKLIGYVVLVIKIVVPLILIIVGMIDLFKSVIGGKDGEVFKSLKSLVMRIIAGVLIFLLPTIVNMVFNLIGNFADVKDDYNVCAKCILNVNNCN